MKFLYILMFVSLWSLGLIFLFHRRRSNLWIALTMLLGGAASYAFAMHLTIMPVFKGAEWLPESVSRMLYLSTVVAMNIHFYLLPFAFFMGGLWLNESMRTRLKQGLSFLGFVGAMALLVTHLRLEPWNSFEVERFRYWDGIYVLLGCYFYYRAYARERDPQLRRVRRRTLVFPLIMCWAYTSDYLGFESLKLGWWSLELDSNGMWHGNVIVILGAVAVILFYTVRYGFLGIKLRIERERLDYSIRTLTMGVSILNHTIKNEIQKIDYLAEKCSALLQSGHTGKAAHTIEQVHGLTRHLLHMVNRIKDKAEDIVLDEGELEVGSLIDSVIRSAATLVENRPVTLSSEYEADGRLICDAVHVSETLSNLIRNALDAMPSGGAITLRSAVTRRDFRIEVSDTGNGIPHEYMSKIFEPFFTTKKNALNYGLGLSYCSSVLSKHGGKLTVTSEPGKGTTFILHFPLVRYRPTNPSRRLKAASKLRAWADRANPS
ncbi:sensor histidine kinase [Paenibacillus rubinfantis]|uniref:sensor histidine kinase n=1 Tax=Paenibacillus rubinfantis TaxID=1720296 RepID=UPI00073F2ABD|nr:HAMP domain-containing sensor histidine kinase [Paenibacillus rubinfantis]